MSVDQGMDQQSLSAPLVLTTIVVVHTIITASVTFTTTTQPDLISDVWHPTMHITLTLSSIRGYALYQKAEFLTALYSFGAGWF